MSGRSRIVCLAYLVLQGVLQGWPCGAAARSPVPNPKTAAPWPWKPRAETLAYAVYVRGVRIGKAVVAVGKPGIHQGEPALQVRGISSVSPILAAAFRLPLAEELTTMVRMGNLRPVRSTLVTKHTRRSKKTITEYGPNRTTQRITGTNGQLIRRRAMASTPLDPLSAMLLLRRAMSRQWQPCVLVVLTGTKVYRVETQASTVEALLVGNRRHRALKISTVLRRTTERGHYREGWRPHKATAWLSADARRVPLRVEVQSRLGPVSLRLVGYRQG